MYIYRYPRPANSVDIVLFRKSGSTFQILLIKRSKNPYQGHYALPGGFVDLGESLEDAAKRELAEETGLKDVNTIQIQTFSDPDRDPRGWVISTAFGAILDGLKQDTLHAGSDAAQAAWIDLSDLPPLAFDHQFIIAAALKKFGLENYPIK